MKISKELQKEILKIVDPGADPEEVNRQLNVVRIYEAREKGLYFYPVLAQDIAELIEAEFPGLYDPNSIKAYIHEFTGGIEQQGAMAPALMIGINPIVSVDAIEDFLSQEDHMGDRGLVNGYFKYNVTADAGSFARSRHGNETLYSSILYIFSVMAKEYVVPVIHEKSKNRIMVDVINHFYYELMSIMASMGEDLHEIEETEFYRDFKNTLSRAKTVPVPWSIIPPLLFRDIFHLVSENDPLISYSRAVRVAETYGKQHGRGALDHPLVHLI